MDRQAQSPAQQVASDTALDRGGAPAIEETSFFAGPLLTPKAWAALPQAPNGAGMRRRAIARVQRDAGNQHVQRLLSRALVQRQSPGGGNVSPIPKLPDLEARKSLALVILKTGFGSRIKTEAKVVGTESESEIRTSYDAAMIRQGKKFRERGAEGEEDALRDWQSGDSAKHPDLSQSGTFKGFSDPSTGQIFVDTSKEPDDQVATIVHEQLHANSAGDFVGELGKQIDEGMTETLTRRAFTASGYAAPTGQYETEVSFVQDLSAMVGGGTLEAAYFSGVDALRTMLNAQADTDIFTEFAAAARGKRWSWMKKFFDEYHDELAKGSELDKKNAAINMALDGWVTDTDIANIAGIYQNASEDDRLHLRATIEGRISELSDHGQRADLRLAMAS